MNPIEPEKTVQDLIEFIKTAFDKARFSRAVIALSGGVDSSTSFALSVKALGKDNVFPLLFPYGDLNYQGVVDANILIDQYGITKLHVSTINIKPIVDPILKLDASIDNVRRGNIMARVRMIVLFDAAKKQNALVIGTENKTEHLLAKSHCDLYLDTLHYNAVTTAAEVLWVSSVFDFFLIFCSLILY